MCSVLIDDQNLLPCSQSFQYYGLTESRFAEQPIGKFPIFEQRFEQSVIEEPRNEFPSVKIPQNFVNRNVFNQGFQAKNVLRSQTLPQTVQQLPQPVPQVAPVERNEPIQQQLVPFNNVDQSPVKASPASALRNIQIPTIDQVIASGPLGRNLIQNTNAFAPQTPLTQQNLPIGQNNFVRSQQIGTPVQNQQALNNFIFRTVIPQSPQFGQQNIVRPAQTLNFAQQ